METLFRKTLGNSHQLKVLEIFIEARELYYSFNDIKEEINLDSKYLSAILKYLQKIEMIISIKTRDNIILYKINLENPIAKKAMEVSDEIIK